MSPYRLWLAGSQHLPYKGVAGVSADVPRALSPRFTWRNARLLTAARYFADSSTVLGLAVPAMITAKSPPSRWSQTGGQGRQSTCKQIDMIVDWGMKKNKAVEGDRSLVG